MSGAAGDQLALGLAAGSAHKDRVRSADFAIQSHGPDLREPADLTCHISYRLADGPVRDHVRKRLGGDRMLPVGWGPPVGTCWYRMQHAGGETWFVGIRSREYDQSTSESTGGRNG